MQNTVKTVDVLPNLPAELDIVVLRPSDRVVKDDPRYQRQFRSDFRVRKGRVMTWLGFLRACDDLAGVLEGAPPGLPTCHDLLRPNRRSSCG